MRMRRILACALLSTLVAATAVAQDATQVIVGAKSEYIVRTGDTLVGAESQYIVRTGDTLASLGARFGVDAAALARMNGLKAAAPLAAGRLLEIDNRHIVPAPRDRGIVINLPQRMLYLFETGALTAHYPVAAGRRGWETPIGPFTVRSKETDPTWDVPSSIQEEMRRNGKPVLTRVLPGPDNPLGAYWIGLSWPSVGIHGTTAPSSIYRFQTHGCIRMHPDTISDLFSRVSTQMPGEIIYEPVLMAATSDGPIYLEVHSDIYRRAGDLWALAQLEADRLGVRDRIDWTAARAAVDMHDGMIHDVSLSADEDR